MRHYVVRATRTLIVFASVAAFLCCLLTVPANAIVTSADYEVTVFAALERPGLMSFSAEGDLYVGNDMDGFTPGQVYVISPDGEIGRHGNLIIDPDVVCVDESGNVSGVPGSVLVGCSGVALAGGHVYAVSPEGVVTRPFDDFGCDNPGEMKFDPSGRFLIADVGFSQQHDIGRLIAYDPVSESFETLVTADTGVGTLAVDGEGRMYAGCYDGSVRLYDTDGTLLNAAVATGFDPIPTPELGPGGVFGDELYVGGSGKIWRYEAGGGRTEIASGFSHVYDIAFGPDDALYCSDFGGYIYRIAPVPEPSTFLMALCGLLGMIGMRRRKH